MNNKSYSEELLILDSYYLELKYYKDQLNILKKHKIFKTKSYYKEKNNLDNKIKECENKIKNYLDNQ